MQLTMARHVGALGNGRDFNFEFPPDLLNIADCSHEFIAFGNWLPDRKCGCSWVYRRLQKCCTLALVSWFLVSISKAKVFVGEAEQTQADCHRAAPH